MYPASNMESFAYLGEFSPVVIQIFNCCFILSEPKGIVVKSYLDVPGS